MIALLHDSHQAAVGTGVSSSSRFRDSIRNSLARQASTYISAIE